MHPLVLREVISVTMILFAIIDILGAIPVIIELRQRVGHIESEKSQYCSTCVNGWVFIWGR